MGITSNPKINRVRSAAKNYIPTGQAPAPKVTVNKSGPSTPTKVIKSGK